MRTIETSTAFKKDFKRELRGRHRLTVAADVDAALRLLVCDKPLAPNYRDHDLTGNWAGYRECHVRPDLLLIYRKPDPSALRLSRLGSHSELFG